MGPAGQPTPEIPRRRVQDHINDHVDSEKTQSELTTKPPSPLGERAMRVRKLNEKEAVAREAQAREHAHERRPKPNINFEIIIHQIDQAVSLEGLKMIIKDLFEKPLGDPTDEAHHPGYPWDENPDDIIGAMSTYIESEGRDKAALKRIPQECQLRNKVAELLPPQALH